MRKFLLPLATALSTAASPLLAAESPQIGVVNFTACALESKLGKKEQENMESIRKQLVTLVEDTEKEMKEIAGKFEDTEYLDSLSPKAEEELKVRFQTLQEDLGRYQNQFYQVLGHANQQMIQKLRAHISKAAEKIALESNLDYVMNDEACFYVRAGEVTQKVIEEMNKTFDFESVAAAQKAAASAPSAEASEMKTANETALHNAK